MRVRFGRVQVKYVTVGVLVPVPDRERVAQGGGLRAALFSFFLAGGVRNVVA